MKAKCNVQNYGNNKREELISIELILLERKVEIIGEGINKLLKQILTVVDSKYDLPSIIYSQKKVIYWAKDNTPLTYEV